MPYVDIKDMTRTILVGKEEDAHLLGISWGELLPEDEVVRLVLTPEVPLPHLHVLSVYLHRATRLPLVDEGRVVRHISPDDIDPQDTQVHLDGVPFLIVNKLTASWQYLCDTTGF